MKNRSAIMKTVPTENKLFLGEGGGLMDGGNNNRRVAKGCTSPPTSCITTEDETIS